MVKHAKLKPNSIPKKQKNVIAKLKVCKKQKSLTSNLSEDKNVSIF